MITVLIIILILLCIYAAYDDAFVTEYMSDITDHYAAYPLKDYLGEMPVYVINLKSRPQRKKRALDELNKFKIKHTFIEAVDGSTLDRDELTDKNIIRCNGSFRELKKGEIGCYLSHIQCWKNILESGKPYGLVLEDDVVFLEDDFVEQFNTMFDKIGNKEWDVICLGRRCKEYFEKCLDGTTVISEDDNVIYPETLGYGTYAYVIKASAIKKLLKTTYPIMKPVDVVLIEEHYGKNIKVIGLIKNMVTVVDIKKSDTQGIK